MSWEDSVLGMWLGGVLGMRLDSVLGMWLGGVSENEVEKNAGARALISQVAAGRVAHWKACTFVCIQYILGTHVCFVSTPVAARCYIDCLVHIEHMQDCG